MTYTIAIANHYGYPSDPQTRTKAYDDTLLCYGYSAHVRRYPNMSFEEYTNDVLVGMGYTIDAIIPQYSYSGGFFTLTDGTKITNKTAPPLLFTWWKDTLDDNNSTLITGIYNIHISFSDESNNRIAIMLKKLCDKFISENRKDINGNSGSYYSRTTSEIGHYKGIIDDIANYYPNMKVWKWNEKIANDFIKKVENKPKSAPDYKSILITKLFNKL